MFLQALLSLQHGLEQRCGILREVTLQCHRSPPSVPHCLLLGCAQKIAVADAGSLMEHLLQRFDSTQLSIANAGERLEEDVGYCPPTAHAPCALVVDSP